MRHCLLLIVSLALFACGSPSANKAEMSLQELSQPIGEEQEQMVQYLKSQYVIPEEARRDSLSTLKFIHDFVTNIDSYQLGKFDYYRLDLEKFQANPSTGNIPRCLTPSDGIFLVASRERKAEYNVVLKRIKKSPEWIIFRVIPDYQGIIGWLPDSLANAGTLEFKIFYYMEKEFITYNQEGEPRYFKINGESLTPEQLSEFLVNEYKRKLDMMQKIHELQKQRKIAGKKS